MVSENALNSVENDTEVVFVEEPEVQGNEKPLEEENTVKPNVMDSIIKGICKGKRIRLKVILTLVLVLLLALAAAYAVHTRRENRKQKTLVQCSTLVTEIRKIKEFCTASYFEETVTSDEQKREHIAIIVKGEIRAGFDLSEMKVDFISDTSIKIYLSGPVILDTLYTTEVFDVKGTWSDNRTKCLIDSAISHIKRNAVAEGIFEQAETHGKERLQSLFRMLGFRHVEFGKMEETEPIS